MPKILLLVLMGYAIGSIPFAILASCLFRLPDPRSYGSGNPGATNVLRTGNKAAALFTLAGDAAKGWFAVWLVQRFGADVTTAALAGLAAFLGHVYSLFLRFRGGKGVATALGVLAGLQPTLALATAGIWLVVAFVSRYSSLAALTAAAGAPFLALLLGLPREVVFVIGAMSVLLFWRHRVNIRQLLNGTEPKFRRARPQPEPPADQA
ncbi:glycerol-3-phosphate 1-O-acyltransferase PlsY [Tepidiphilus baoligensis]|uniref:Glycerol-3-phosphate acyltransferase n=1 Tax=Tepidiphilus baoligensis TaxID=2698687 RepID=A0ABX1QL09_9PROT|nr:glycerol-3-phosphate 1-O-acyltransferase PlsY [Tepidiphilus baoligensis]NMH16611.1 glycerol-3-phosphate 1-O-acyltransferase PlsY [Tepidiphilus baoligensis]